MDKVSLSIDYAVAMLEPLHARGYNTDELLDSIGLKEAIRSPSTRCSVAKAGALRSAIVGILDDEFLVQDSRGRLKSGSIELLCQILVQCDTLGSALLRMTQFFNLLLDDFVCGLAGEGNISRLTIFEKPNQLAPRVMAHEFLLFVQYGIACWLTGRRITLQCAGFGYPELPRCADYHALLATSMHFNQRETSWTFDRLNLDLPVVQNSERAHDFLHNLVFSVVLKYKNTTGVSARIRRKLRTLASTPGAGWPDFDVFAKGLNMTPSTLRRRLDEEGQSFQVIKDQLRRDMAIDFLNHSSKSVVEIAWKLGYAEPSAFHRAFKKWTGIAPAEFRRHFASAGVV